MRERHPGVYHVTARSNAEEHIFRDDRDYVAGIQIPAALTREGFPRRHGRRGHVFDSPYRSIPVEDERHGDWVPTYIAENPPRRPWPWSSYDNLFSFVEPLPWLEAPDPGSS